MMKIIHSVPVFGPSLAFAASLASCAQPSTGDAQAPVPVMADYHKSFDAISFSGTLRRDEECIVLIGSDGTRNVPVFRNMRDATELARKFDLVSGETVTVNGMNRFPNNGPMSENFRPWAKCGTYFFAYGGIDSGSREPLRPANAPEN